MATRTRLVLGKALVQTYPAVQIRHPLRPSLNDTPTGIELEIGTK